MDNKNKKTITAYRVVESKYQDYYKNGETQNIPNLEGKFYIKEEDKRCNDFNYDSETRYLHFFTEFHDAEKYAEELLKTNSEQKNVILKFTLPESEKFQYGHGGYFSFVTMKNELRPEVLVEENDYNKLFYEGEVNKQKEEKDHVPYYDPDAGWGMF